MNRSKKVWILTRRAGYNFGTSLQAYAMTYVIDRLGFANRLIDLNEYRFRGKVRLWLWDIAYVVIRLCPFLWKKVNAPFFRNCLDFYKQRRKFRIFEKDCFPLTRRFDSYRQLAKAAFDCDMLICGSDQIWSPVHFNPVMFLNFANNRRTRTIAYAPSIGLNGIGYHREEIASLVRRIDYISVRETQGAQALEELTGRKTFVALDPTLLVTRDEWTRIAVVPSMAGAYILSYFLDTENVPYRFLRSIAETTGYRIVNLQTNYSRIFLSGAENRGDISPREFIGLVSEAAFVCTNSFHGTIFSIHFAKQFFVFDRFEADSTINQNSRIDTLLETLSLQNRRMFTDGSYDPRCDEPIDYRQVYRLLEEKKSQSFDFLISALHGTDSGRKV